MSKQTVRVTVETPREKGSPILLRGFTLSEVVDHLLTIGADESEPLAFLSNLGKPVTVPLASSWLESATYDLLSGDLTLNTEDGSNIELYNVPVDEFQRLVSLTSGAGKHYHRELKGNY